MKKKNIISLSVAFAFLALSTTGILLYIKQKAHAVEITHTIFGLLFVSFAIFHIINNWSSITGYSKERKSGKYQKEFMVASFAFLVLLVGGVTEFLEPVAEAGKIFAAKKEKQEQLNFPIVKTNGDSQGREIEFIIEKEENVELPIIAIWTEDSANNFVENLFVPSKVASIPESEEEAREGNFEMSDFNPKNLSQWSFKAKTQTPNFVKETPHDNFILKTKTYSNSNFYVFLEIKNGNQSELYSAFVDISKSTVFRLVSPDNKFLKKAIITL